MIENEPDVRRDVHREDDVILSPEQEIAQLRSGNSTQMKEYWKTKRDSEASSRDRLVLMKIIIIILYSYSASY